MKNNMDWKKMLKQFCKKKKHRLTQWGVWLLSTHETIMCFFYNKKNKKKMVEANICLI